MKSVLFGFFLICILCTPDTAWSQQKLNSIEGEPEIEVTLQQELEQIFISVETPENLEMKYVEVESPDGKPVPLKKNTEKMTLLNYWAPWCIYCIAELPDLRALQTRHPEIEIMYIGDGKSSVLQLREMMETAQLPVEKTFFDIRGFFKREMKIKGVPMTIIVDRTGNVLYKLEGDADWDLPVIEKMLVDAKKRAEIAEKNVKNN